MKPAERGALNQDTMAELRVDGVLESLWNQDGRLKVLVHNDKVNREATAYRFSFHSLLRTKILLECCRRQVYFQSAAPHKEHVEHRPACKIFMPIVTALAVWNYQGRNAQ